MLGCKSATIPPACEQYLKALEACTLNQVTFFERTNIPMAKQAKQALKEIQTARVNIKKAVAKDGIDTVAERCTKPEFVGKMNDLLAATMMPMMWGKALDNNCVTRFNEIQY